MSFDKVRSVECAARGIAVREDGGILFEKSPERTVSQCRGRRRAESGRTRPGFRPSDRGDRNAPPRSVRRALLADGWPGSSRTRSCNAAASRSAFMKPANGGHRHAHLAHDAHIHQPVEGRELRRRIAEDHIQRRCRGPLRGHRPDFLIPEQTLHLQPLHVRASVRATSAQTPPAFARSRRTSRRDVPPPAPPSGTRAMRQVPATQMREVAATCD